MEIQPRLFIEKDVPHWFHGSYLYTVNLRVGESKGRVGLKKIGNNILETHSSLDECLLDKGYGIMMYFRAIELGISEGFYVCSSRHEDMTVDARYLWQSRRLGEKFRIRRDTDRFRVLSAVG